MSSTLSAFLVEWAVVLLEQWLNFMGGRTPVWMPIVMVGAMVSLPISLLHETFKRGRLPTFRELSGPPAHVGWKKLFAFTLPAIIAVLFIQYNTITILTRENLSGEVAMWFLIGVALFVPWMVYLMHWMDKQRPTWEEYERRNSIERRILEGEDE